MKDVTYVMELPAVFELDDSVVEFTVDEAIGEFYNRYPGPYEVSPGTTTITLSTMDKLATKNITIEPISYTAIRNSAGGLTIKIG